MSDDTKQQDAKATEEHNVSHGHPHDDELHWSIIKSVETEDEATLIEGYLHANDIPAKVESLRFNEMPVNVGDMAEVRIRVPEEHAEAARQLLEDRETDSLADEAEAAERDTDPPTGSGPEGDAQGSA